MLGAISNELLGRLTAADRSRLGIPAHWPATWPRLSDEDRRRLLDEGQRPSGVVQVAPSVPAYGQENGPLVPGRVYWVQMRSAPGRWYPCRRIGDLGWDTLGRSVRWLQDAEVISWHGPLAEPPGPAHTRPRPPVHDATDLEVSG